ncbi:MAG: hypothetical protein QNK37_28445 [Acidobacteriota bacterium]|nr:hypothetical protein [Acidobacteriota bacterium]
MASLAFSDFEAHKSIFDFIVQKKTGTLIFQPQSRKLFFQSGHLVFASSDNNTEHFSQILVSNGVISPQTLEQVKAELKKGESLGKKLKGEGHADAQQLVQSLKQQITTIVDAVFALESGEYEIQEGPLPPKVPTLKIQALALIIRTINGLKSRQFLRALPFDNPMRLSPDFSTNIAAFEFPGSYSDFLDHIQQKNRFMAAEISTDFDWNESLTQGIFYVLHSLGLVEFQEPEPEPELMPFPENLEDGLPSHHIEDANPLELTGGEGDFAVQGSLFEDSPGGEDDDLDVTVVEGDDNLPAVEEDEPSELLLEDELSGLPSDDEGPALMDEDEEFSLEEQPVASSLEEDTGDFSMPEEPAGDFGELELEPEKAETPEDLAFDDGPEPQLEDQPAELDDALADDADDFELSDEPASDFQLSDEPTGDFQLSEVPASTDEDAGLDQDDFSLEEPPRTSDYDEADFATDPAVEAGLENLGREDEAQVDFGFSETEPETPPADQAYFEEEEPRYIPEPEVHTEALPGLGTSPFESSREEEPGRQESPEFGESGQPTADTEETEPDAVTIPGDQVIMPEEEYSAPIPAASSGGSRRVLLIALPVIVIIACLAFLYQKFMPIGGQGPADEGAVTAAAPDPESGVTEPADGSETPEPGDADDPVAAGGADDPAATADTEEPVESTVAQTTPPPQRSEASPETTTDSTPVVEKPESTAATTAPPKPAPTSAVDASAYARDSRERFREKQNAYSIALILACEQATVDKFLAKFAGEELYVFPKEFQGRDCRTITWGSFSTYKEAAAQLKNIPPGLAEGGSPWVKKLQEFL